MAAGASTRRALSSEFGAQGKLVDARVLSRRGVSAEPNHAPVRVSTGPRLEVNWSTRGLRKLEVWRRFGVPEAWVWEDSRLRVFRLNSNQHYVPAKKSKLLPKLDLGLLSEFVGVRNQLVAVKAFRAAIRAKPERSTPRKN